METTAARIRRLHIRIFVLLDRLERAKSRRQTENILLAVNTAYHRMCALVAQVDLEREPPGAAG